MNWVWLISHVWHASCVLWSQRGFNSHSWRDVTVATCPLEYDCACNTYASDVDCGLYGRKSSCVLIYWNCAPVSNMLAAKPCPIVLDAHKEFRTTEQTSWPSIMQHDTNELNEIALGKQEPQSHTLHSTSCRYCGMALVADDMCGIPTSCMMRLHETAHSQKPFQFSSKGAHTGYLHSHTRTRLDWAGLT